MLASPVGVTALHGLAVHGEAVGVVQLWRLLVSGVLNSGGTNIQ